jgi:DNA end-binding protein Ku
VAATVWKGHLSFGLISIPVRIYRAARPEKIAMHQLRRAPVPRAPSSGKVLELPRPGLQRMPQAETAPVERVRRVAVTQSEQERPVLPAELVKGYEVRPEQWVVVDREDLKRIAPQTSRTIDVVEFVPFAEIDPIYLETSYYVAPEKSGEKAYALLYAALRQAGFAGLGRIAMHNREHVLVVRTGRRGLIAHTMYYPDEVREQEERQADLALVKSAELDLAVQFVGSLAASFEPGKYRDTYRERLEQLIEARAAGAPATEAPAPQPAAPVGDLMQALQRSLAASRKPPAQEPARAKKRRKTSVD